MRCSICGTEIPTGARFCPGCAAALDGEGNPRPPQGEAAWEYRELSIPLDAVIEPASAGIPQREARLIRDAVERMRRDGWRPAGLSPAASTGAPDSGGPGEATIVRVRRERPAPPPPVPAGPRAAPDPSPPAILQFRYGPERTGVARSGVLRPGGRLRVSYDPARFLASHPQAKHRLEEGEILAHLRFHPGGQTHSGRVASPLSPSPPAGELRSEALEVVVAPDAHRVEVWFEYRARDGSQQWDSRYGRNFWFDVDREGVPPRGRAVAPRADAVADPEMVSVFASTAVKQRRGAGGMGSWVETRLAVGAWVRNVAFEKRVWIDAHVLDAEGQVVHTATLPLQYLDGLGPEGDLFGWEDAIYHGSRGGSGTGVQMRPDADQVQFRLYFQAGEPVYTDGWLYQLDLPPDASVPQLGSTAVAGPLIHRGE